MYQEPDLHQLELRRTRTLAHLDLYQRVLVSLAAKVSHLRHQLDAAGRLAEWDALEPMDIEGKEKILMQMRRRGQWP
jgi:hypothetical protein